MVGAPRVEPTQAPSLQRAGSSILLGRLFLARLNLRRALKPSECRSGRAIGAVASAAVLHTVGRGFESLIAHHFPSPAQWFASCARDVPASLTTPGNNNSIQQLHPSRWRLRASVAIDFLRLPCRFARPVCSGLERPSRDLGASLVPCAPLRGFRLPHSTLLLFQNDRWQIIFSLKRKSPLPFKPF